MKWPGFNSIAVRIQWGYFLLVASVIIGLIITWINLSHVQERIFALETTSELLDTVLEIRRYEKNWLLYHEGSDYQANEAMIATAINILKNSRRGLVELDPMVTIARLEEVLSTYRSLMAQEFVTYQTDHQHTSIDEIRSQGKLMVNIAELMSQQVRNAIARTLAFVSVSGAIFVLFFVILAVVLARHITISIINPLQQIVACTRKIAAGELYSCKQVVKEIGVVEVEAVLQAFEVMLAKLEQREKQMIHSEKLAAVGTLVAGIAHELNNPLSNAGTSGQILLEEIRESEEVPRSFQIEMLEQVVEQTDRARTIVRSLLEFSREKEVHPEHLKMSDLLHQTIDLIRGEIPSNVAVKVIVDEDGLFRADKRRLQQALVNLLLNALQALDEGKQPDSQVVLRGRVWGEDNAVTIQVVDNGPGIPALIMDRIFDPFFTTKEVGHGSGLGLSVTREIIGKHGGTIGVESKEGQGTTFTINLPIDLPVEQAEQPELTNERA